MKDYDERKNVKLIYHPKESSNGGISPFNKTIKEIAKDKKADIVCPYIGFEIFKHIVKFSTSWRLITDVEAWIKSDLSNVLKIKDFILKNCENIHHCKDIHAKVIITDENIFIGSANLTVKGFTVNREMSVLITENEIVDELQKWFDDLWIDTGSLDIPDLETFVKFVNSRKSTPTDKNGPTIPSKAPLIKAKLGNSGNTQEKDLVNSHHNRLVKAIKKLPNRDWVNSYFDLANEMIEFTGLTNDDPKLSMSIRKDKMIPITINQRMVLLPYKEGDIGLIMPMKYDKQNYDKDRAEEVEDYYFTNKKDNKQDARWLRFERKDKIEFSKNLKDYWKQAVLRELNRGKKSKTRKKHKQIVYKAITNLYYRNELLNEAFSE